MSTEEQGWKEYADSSPLILKFELKKTLKDVMPITILETKYRRTVNEQMGGLVKLEHAIEIRHGKNSAEHAFSMGMVAADSPQASRVKHLSSAEKIEATRKFCIDKANEERLGHLFGVSKQGIVELVTAISTGKVSVVKEAKSTPVKEAKGTPAKKAKSAPVKEVKGTPPKKAKSTAMKEAMGTRKKKK